MICQQDKMFPNLGEQRWKNNKETCILERKQFHTKKGKIKIKGENYYPLLIILVYIININKNIIWNIIWK